MAQYASIAPFFYRFQGVSRPAGGRNRPFCGLDVLRHFDSALFRKAPESFLTGNFGAGLAE